MTNDQILEQLAAEFFGSIDALYDDHLAGLDMTDTEPWERTA